MLRCYLRTITAANSSIVSSPGVAAADHRLVLGAAICPRQLSFDQSIENMFAADDPLLVPYRRLTRTFGGNEIALAAYVDPNF